jgi:hypothetical protein
VTIAFIFDNFSIGNNNWTTHILSEVMWSRKDEDYVCSDADVGPVRERKVDRAAERERQKQRRAKNAILHGDEPGKPGRWPILLQSEEAELVRCILEWPEDDLPPRISDLPFLVYQL